MRAVRGCIWTLLTLGLVLPLGGMGSAQTAQKQTHKVIIYPSANESVDQLKKQGVTNVANYGSFWVAETDDAQAEVVRKLYGDRVMKADYLNRVELAAMPLDTTVGEPVVPAHLRQAAQKGKNLRLIQFKGPVLSEWLEQVKKTGDVKVASYVPNNAYIVWLDRAAEDNLSKLMAPSGPIQWIGAYHPYYKMDPALANVGTSSIDVQVGVVNRPEAEQTVQAIGRYALEQLGKPGVVGKQIVTKIKVAPSDVASIAQMPDVLWIQRSAPMEPKDEEQSLILADRISQLPGHSPVPGVDDYLDLLTNVWGFSTDATQYPILDVADTLATATTSFNDFFESGNPSNTTRLAGFLSLCPPGAVLCDNSHGPFVMSTAAGYNDSKSDPVNLDMSGFRKGLGVSPFGRISNTILYNISGLCVFCVPNSVHPTLADIPLNEYMALGARISNNSWGESPVAGSGGNVGIYNGDSLTYDIAVRDALDSGVTNGFSTPSPARLNQELITMFAGGNAQALGTGNGGFGDIITTPPATAKNVITVGASENVRRAAEAYNQCGLFPNEADNSFDIAVFSSFGPTLDGRFKPEIVAPGAAIFGVDGLTTNLFFTIITIGTNQFVVPTTGNAYICESGTSFSAPAVSGGMQLLWWWFEHRLQNEQGQFLLQPSPAMAKAYVCNSARYLPITNPQTGAPDTLPSIAQGMGEMDLARMFDGMPRLIRDESTPRAIDTPLMTTNPVPQQTFFSRSGQSYEVSGFVADPTQPFRVTLAWTDAPGNPGAFQQLVNDLDLLVTIGGQTYKGNMFVGPYSVIGGNTDNINNMESVFLPPGHTGTWSVVVRASDLAGQGVPNVRGANTDQDFALVVYNAAASPAPSDVPNLLTNNSCQTAMNISGFPFTFTNNLTKAIYRNVHPSPSAARGGVDEFFEIRQPAAGTQFTIDTFGSSFDTVLSVWQVQTYPQSVFAESPCGALVELASNNDAAGGFQSQVTFTADGSNTYFIVVEPHNDGPGGTMVLNVRASSLVTISPTALVFGARPAGSTSTVQNVTIQDGAQVGVDINNVTIEGANPSGFVILSDSCLGNTISPGGNCTISVAFTPTTTGTNTAQLVVQSDTMGGPLVVPLSGVGLAPSPINCLSANSLSFGGIGIGSTSIVQSVTITNCGTAVLVVSNAVITGVNKGDFAIASSSCSNVTPGGVCTFDVTFAPSASGLRSAVLTIEDSATSGANTVTLTGTGTSIQPYLLISTKVTAKTFVGNHIYDPTGLSKTVTQSVKRGGKGVFYVPIGNDGNAADSFLIRGAGDSAGFTVKYYLGASGNFDITDAVVAGSYRTSNLAPGAITGDATMIRVEVTVSRTAAKGARKNVLVSGFSNTDSSKEDTVQAVVLVK
ncbi:MAG: choice-of-anchor D domain-containing protein [Verrucomicrobiia bacterium]